MIHITHVANRIQNYFKEKTIIVPTCDGNPVPDLIDDQALMALYGVRKWALAPLVSPAVVLWEKTALRAATAFLPRNLVDTKHVGIFIININHINSTHFLLF
jgi:hypothetical protein